MSNGLQRLINDVAKEAQGQDTGLSKEAAGRVQSFLQGIGESVGKAKDNVVDTISENKGNIAAGTLGAGGIATGGAAGAHSMGVQNQLKQNLEQVEDIDRSQQGMLAQNRKQDAQQNRALQQLNKRDRQILKMLQQAAQQNGEQAQRPQQDQ